MKRPAPTSQTGLFAVAARACLGIALLGACAGSAWADDIVYQQNPQNTGDGNDPFANFNHAVQTQRSADNFMLATPAAVSRVVWWGWTYNNQTNQQGATANLLGFDIRIMAADGALGAPATVLSQQFVPIASVAITNLGAGPLAGQSYRFEAPLAANIALAAGPNYWLAVNAVVINTANNGDAFVWTRQRAGTGNPGNNTIAVDGLITAPDDVWDLTVYGDDLAFQILAVSDSDSDGLSDTDEAYFGSNPNDPDTDNDGLLDGTEVDLFTGGSCLNLLDPDSDNDTLTDGDEVTMGTSPCDIDTDGDGIADPLDALPLTPNHSNAQIAEAIRATADFIAETPLSAFSGPNNNARSARRNSMSNTLQLAAGFAQRGLDLPAALLILTVELRIDGFGAPPDFMLDSADRDIVRMFVDMILDLVIN